MFADGPTMDGRTEIDWPADLDPSHSLTSHSTLVAQVPAIQLLRPTPQSMAIDNILQRDDQGLLWVLHENGQKTLPIIESTNTFLRFLRQPVPGDDVDVSSVESDGEEVSLFCNKGTTEHIDRVLNHIQSFHRGEPRSGQRRINHREAKLKAMEHQRDRLQKQLSASTDDNEPDEEDEKENPWIHLARVLNSLCLVTPHLLAMLLHPRRNDIHSFRTPRGRP